MHVRGVRLIMQVRCGFSIVASNGQLDVWALVTLASTLKVRLGGGVEVVATQTAHTGKGERDVSVCVPPRVMVKDKR